MGNAKRLKDRVKAGLPTRGHVGRPPLGPFINLSGYPPGTARMLDQGRAITLCEVCADGRCVPVPHDEATKEAADEVRAELSRLNGVALYEDINPDTDSWDSVLEPTEYEATHCVGCGVIAIEFDGFFDALPSSVIGRYITGVFRRTPPP